MTSAEIDVRPYRPSDRDAVRRICFVTGYMGDPVAWIWRDAESFADLWTSYYTDHEPGSASVAERDGRVVGYLLGCRNTRAAGTPIRAVQRHLIRRGLLFRPGTAGVLWRSAADLARARLRHHLPATELDDPRWPAHLHIDLLPEARGSRSGRRLMQRWLDVLRDEDIAGCHLGTWGENAKAIAFFEATGFRRHGPPEPMVGMRSPHGRRHTTQWMVQDLGPRTP